MAIRHEELSQAFYEWEIRGRGWTVFDEPVHPEPPFVPFEFRPPQEEPDDGRKPTLLSSLYQKLVGVQSVPREREDVAEETAPAPFYRRSLIEIEVGLPKDTNIAKDAMEHLLASLSLIREPIAFELFASDGRVHIRFASEIGVAQEIETKIAALFPECILTRLEHGLQSAWENSNGSDVLVVEFGLEEEFVFPLAAPSLDPFAGIVAALARARANEIAVLQVLFQPTEAPWAEAVMRAVSHADGKPIFVNAPELTKAAKAKVSRPLYAAVIRLALKTGAPQRTLEIARAIAGSLRVYSNPLGNQLIPLANEEYPFEAHVEDVLLRQSRRSGMILTLDELISFVHLPSSAVRSPALFQGAGKTKAAPETARAGILLGENIHAGRKVEVRLSPDARVCHCHVIGASGTGKSTLLYNLIRQDIENGEGVALLDPHGDLVDRILGIIPEHRIKDVILVDPADEEYSVGFNILSAHSDFEKNLLASDLVSVFQRLSTSWGDQMGSVLQNAILAFLESDRGGSLSDLRRFLVDASYRNSFLATVRDPDIVFYWRNAFTQLSGNKSIGSVLTRLDTFLAPKPIRYMVSQRSNRLDFADITDTGKIFLARLPRGEMGSENSFLLGSLLVAKFQQAAMARQRQKAESRRNFWIYLDEFHNFITPSMAEILTGARKYRVGLILAHQDLRQLERDREVGSAVLSNPYTRIIFRVGDADARALEHGLSFFEAKDLQNLERGEAICRLEKAAGDFNLSVSLRDEPRAEDQARRREEVVAASRNRYATPRREIEKVRVESSPVTEPPNPADIPPPSAPQATPPPPSPTAIPLPGPDAVPSIEATQISPKAEEIKTRLIQIAGKFGYSYTEECKLPDEKRVDLAFTRMGETIACEIGARSKTAQEVANIVKCIGRDFSRLVHICEKANFRKQIKSMLRDHVSLDEFAKVEFLTIEDFEKSLQLPPPTEPSTPEKALPEPTEVLSPEAQQEREREMLAELRRLLKRQP